MILINPSISHPSTLLDAHLIFCQAYKLNLKQFLQLNLSKGYVVSEFAGISLMAKYGEKNHQICLADVLRQKSEYSCCIARFRHLDIELSEHKCPDLYPYKNVRTCVQIKMGNCTRLDLLLYLSFFQAR